MSSVSGGAVSYLRHLAPLLARRFTESSEGHRLKLLAHEDQRDLLDGIDMNQVVWVQGVRPVGVRRVVWEMRNMRRRLGQQAREEVLHRFTWEKTWGAALKETLRRIYS